MKTISYTESRKNYAEVMDQVIDDREPTLITRAGHESVVMMALDDFNAMQEMAHLTRSAANVQHLNKSFEQARAGLTTHHNLIDE